MIGTIERILRLLRSGTAGGICPPARYFRRAGRVRRVEARLQPPRRAVAFVEMRISAGPNTCPATRVRDLGDRLRDVRDSLSIRRHHNGIEDLQELLRAEGQRQILGIEFRATPAHRQKSCGRQPPHGKDRFCK